MTTNKTATHCSSVKQKHTDTSVEPHSLFAATQLLYDENNCLLSTSVHGSTALYSCQLGMERKLSSAALVVAADQASALLRGSALLAWCCSITGEGLQKCLGPFQLSLSFPIPPSLFLSHQLHHLHYHHLCYTQWTLCKDRSEHMHQVASTVSQGCLTSSQATRLCTNGAPAGQQAAATAVRHYPREGFLASSVVQEGQAAPACYEVLWCLTVLMVHGVHHLCLQHRVAPHQAPPQLALLCYACYVLCSVSI